MNPSAAVESEPVARSPAAPSPRLGAERLARLAARVAAPAGRPKLPVAMPFTGEVLGEVPRASRATCAWLSRAPAPRRRLGAPEIAERVEVFPASTTW